MLPLFYLFWVLIFTHTYLNWIYIFLRIIYYISYASNFHFLSLLINQLFYNIRLNIFHLYFTDPTFCRIFFYSLLVILSRSRYSSIYNSKELDNILFNAVRFIFWFLRQFLLCFHSLYSLSVRLEWINIWSIWFRVFPSGNINMNAFCN